MKVLLAAAVLAVFAVGAFVVLSGGGDDQPEPGDRAGAAEDAADDPVRVVDEYIAAMREGDCAAALDLVTESSLELFGGSEDGAVAACEAQAAEIARDLAIDDLEVASNDGTTATITGVGTAGGETEPVEITLRREDGAWRIDLTSVTDADAGGEAGTGESAEPTESTESTGSSPTTAGDSGSAPSSTVGPPPPPTITDPGPTTTLAPPPSIPNPGPMPPERDDCNLSPREVERLTASERAAYLARCRGTNG
ncbi:MAG TPA: hypothetical protein VIL48_00255 [Acidimicrobiales bacterium]